MKPLALILSPLQGERKERGWLDCLFGNYFRQPLYTCSVRRET